MFIPHLVYVGSVDGGSSVFHVVWWVLGTGARVRVCVRVCVCVCVRECVLFGSCIGKSNSPIVVEVQSSSGTPGVCMCTCMYVCTQNPLITRPTPGDKQFHSVFGTPVRKSAPTSTHVHTHANTHAAACTHAHITSSIK